MKIRRATAEDAATLAEIIYLADLSQYQTSGYALTIGGDETHILATLAQLVVTKARGMFHYSHFDVAEVDGVVACGIAGFDGTVDDAMVPALLEIGWTNQRIDELLDLLSPLGEAKLENLHGAWIVDHVATLPAFRGQHLAPQVLAAVLDRGRELGYKIAEVDVFEGNDRAARIYEQAGFRLVQSHSGAEMRRFLNRDPMRRMRMAL